MEMGLKILRGWYKIINENSIHSISRSGPCVYTELVYFYECPFSKLYIITYLHSSVKYYLHGIDGIIHY